MTSSQIETSGSSQLFELTKSLIDNITSDSIMSQSLDPNMLNANNNSNVMNSSMHESIVLSKQGGVSGANLYNGRLFPCFTQSTSELIFVLPFTYRPTTGRAGDYGWSIGRRLKNGPRTGIAYESRLRTYQFAGDDRAAQYAKLRQPATAADAADSQGN